MELCQGAIAAFLISDRESQESNRGQSRSRRVGIQRTATGDMFRSRGKKRGLAARCHATNKFPADESSEGDVATVALAIIIIIILGD